MGKHDGYRSKQEIAESFWAKVIIGGQDDCWSWTGARDRNGVPKFYVRINSVVTAARFLWNGLHGELPRRYVVKHTCKNQVCLNPNHLYVNNAAIHLHKICDDEETADIIRRNVGRKSLLIAKPGT